MIMIALVVVWCLATYVLPSFKGYEGEMLVGRRHLLRTEYTLELEGQSGYIEFSESSLEKHLMTITVGDYRLEFWLH